MDQSSKYVMWSKRRALINLRPHEVPSPFEFRIGSAYNNNHSSARQESWEEQAFAEDTLLHVWPPRSYSCAFCRREFRSAQALGGHMNVHRRDRARLRQQQPSSPPNSTPSDDCELTDPSLNCSPNDNYKHDPSYANSVAKDHEHNCKDPISTALIVNNNTNKEGVLVAGSLKRKDDSLIDELEDALNSNSKRRCSAVSSCAPPPDLFASSNLPIQLQQLRNEVTIKGAACPMEELDLELRLGYAGYCPKII